jgi:hypothetical protein
MSNRSRLAGVLLIGTALTAPVQALAQDSAPPPADQPPAGEAPSIDASQPAQEEEVERGHRRA